MTKKTPPSSGKRKLNPKRFPQKEQDFYGNVLSFEDAVALSEDSLNGAIATKINGKIAVLPGDLESPEVVISQLLNARLFHYLPAAQGVLLAHRNLHVSSHLASTYCDHAFAHLSYTVNAVVFRPSIGRQLRGVVSQLSSVKHHVTCQVCQVLNVTVPLDANRSVPYRIGDVISVEITNFSVAPNGTVSIVAKKCDIKDFSSAKVPLVMKNSLNSSSSSNTPAAPVTPRFPIKLAQNTPINSPTPTWLQSASKKAQQIPTGRHIKFSSSSSSSSSSSESDSNDISNVIKDIKPTMAQLEKHTKKIGLAKAKNNLNWSSSDYDDDSGAELVAAPCATKLEPMTPTRSVQKRKKKKKYLAD